MVHGGEPCSSSASTCLENCGQTVQAACAPAAAESLLDSERIEIVDLQAAARRRASEHYRSARHRGTRGLSPVQRPDGSPIPPSPPLFTSSLAAICASSSPSFKASDPLPVGLGCTGLPSHQCKRLLLVIILREPSVHLHNGGAFRPQLLLMIRPAGQLLPPGERSWAWRHAQPDVYPCPQIDPILEHLAGDEGDASRSAIDACPRDAPPIHRPPERSTRHDLAGIEWRPPCAHTGGTSTLASRHAARPESGRHRHTRGKGRHIRRRACWPLCGGSCRA
jgi:hypothetical protein